MVYLFNVFVNHSSNSAYIRVIKLHEKNTHIGRIY